MTQERDRNVERIEKMHGGQGHVLIERILGEKELNGKCGLYAKVTIEPKCSLGYHEHHGESETYYILSGTGLYNDNGVEIPVKAGDSSLYSRWLWSRIGECGGNRSSVYGAHYF